MSNTDIFGYLVHLLVIGAGGAGFSLATRSHPTAVHLVVFCVAAGVAVVGMTLFALLIKPRQKQIKSLEDRVAALEKRRTGNGAAQVAER